MATAKVFMNGRSQAIRLPKSFRVAAKEVHLKRTSEGILIMERNPWDVFKEGCFELSEGYMKRRTQPPLKARKSL